MGPRSGFLDQARQAFRRTRAEMGSVNAELQEVISAVREVQAFNRAEENIENFTINAANRDANIRGLPAPGPRAGSPGLPGLKVARGPAAGGWVLLTGQTLGSASLGIVVTFIYVQRFNQPIQQIAVLDECARVASGERIFDLLDEVPQVQGQTGRAPHAARFKGK
ncbi:MAG: hypothetical protein U0401_27320 [Anaerolineae bacterium]